VSTPVIAGPYLAAVVLLGAAGAAKAVRPGDTARALADAGRPVGRTAVRAGAVAEIALAVAALVAPGPLTGALVALAYTAFAGFVGLALRRGWALSSCGCFGRPDARPGPAHAALNAGAAAAAVWWAAVAPSHLGAVFSPQAPWHGAALGVVTAVLCGLAYLVWTDPLPAARR
jgi:hypothetical protein